MQRQITGILCMDSGSPLGIDRIPIGLSVNGLRPESGCPV